VSFPIKNGWLRLKIEYRRCSEWDLKREETETFGVTVLDWTIGRSLIAKLPF